MKLLLVSVGIVAACGGAPSGGPPPASPAAAADLPAARFIPASPTYVVAAHSVRDGQRALRDLSDTYGMAVNVDASSVSSLLTAVLAVDPLSPDALAGIGIDVDGGLVMFSEQLAPTFVAHLSAPDATQAFIERQRSRGLVTQSVVADGAEVFSADLGAGVHLSWVVDKDWLWVHLAFRQADGPAWFAHSHHPEAARWAEHWAWAKHSADRLHAAGVVGFFDLPALIAGLPSRASNAAACVRLVEPIGHVAIALEGDLHHAAGRLAFDLGPSAKAIASRLLPPPAGWAGAAASAPLAAELNLDVHAVGTWLEPCAALVGLDGGVLKSSPIRAARALVLTFDPDEKDGTGAVAIDADSTSFAARYLDQIPMRSHFEHDRKFGAYAGKALSIPFGPKVDYVLTDRVGIAAMGEGLLDKVVAGAPPTSPPVLSLDLAPPGLSAKAWQWMLDAAGIPHAAYVAERLLHWHDGHLRVVLDGDALVIDASGTRR